MMPRAKHMGSIDASPESPTFRQQMQKADGTFGVEKVQKPVPMKANPVHNCDPGLGAKTIAHPFKKGKQHI